MANTTERIKIGVTGYESTKRYLDFVTTAQTYYPGAAIGRKSTGYATKFDDSELLSFAGFYCESNSYTVESGLSAGDYKLKHEVDRPQFATIAIDSVAITDIGKVVYASYDGTFTLTATTYRNYIGKVEQYIDSTHCLVRLDYGLRSGTDFLVACDPGSIANAGMAEVTLTATGLQTTDVVVVQPQSGITAGLALVSWYISAADTLKVRIINLSGGSVDLSSFSVLVKIV